MVDSYFAGSGFVGGVCGRNDGTISGCYSTATVSSAASTGGVLVGCSWKKVENSFAYGTALNSARSLDSFQGGITTNCFYLSHSAVEESYGYGVTEATADEFTNGAVAYKLAADSSDPTATTQWGQTFGTDTYPVLGGAKVYCVEGYYHNHNGSCAACNDPGKPDKAGDTYQIASYENLLWFAKLANGTLMQGMPAKPAANAVLMQAIDITVDTVDTVGTVGKSWPGIGTSDAPYNGSFNGNGHTVSLTSADVSTAAANRRR